MCDGRRRQFLIVAGALLAAPLAAKAQAQGKAYRIGWLGTNKPTTRDLRRLVEPFEQALRGLGYVEGKNTSFERRYSEGKVERFPELAAELVRLRVDVIVAAATPAAQAAQRATGKIPIVMVAVVDPVGAGLVASLGRPGGNITGLAVLPAGLTGKRLEFLKEVAPKTSRVAVLWNPANQSNELQLREAEVAAKALGVRLHPLEVREPQDVEVAFQAAALGRANALLVLEDPLILGVRAQIVALAAKRKLPAVYGSLIFTDIGGLMSYGTNLPEHFRQAARFVDKILKGTVPADIPVEQPMTFELVVNLRTAKALGLRIPPLVLLSANRLIE